MAQDFYKKAVIYQVWPRSFKDGNGDGIGDLYGILEKLDYIKSVGATAIWFSPLYTSPQADYGYDIADYYTICTDYGDLDTFKKVLDGAHERGMKVIMDLVVNHTSDEHPWFLESKKSKDNPYHDYYIWRRGKGKNPPNNWKSMFEGGAWEYNKDLDEYYLHVFSKKQPDLNMDNPKVRDEVKRIMDFWLSMGVDGFREDVITFISKKEGLPNGLPLPVATGVEHYKHGPHLMEYLEEFRKETLEKHECFMVGESPMTGAKDALELTTGKDKVLDMLISFDHMQADCIMTDTVSTPFNLIKLKKAFDTWQEKLYGKSWNALYLENHDHPRIISRYGSEKFRKESGKMLATMCYMQCGTPFIYQGQEIGMVNTHLERLSDFKDVVTFNNEKIFKKLGFSDAQYLKIANKTSRENARTPMQWDSGAYGGFSEAEPWFPVNPNYKEINVAEAEKDPDSILHYYRKLFKIRQESDLFIYGAYRDLLPKDKKIYCYERTLGTEKALIVCSFSETMCTFRTPEDYNLEKGKLVLCNYKDAPAKAHICALRPYEARVYVF